jgi:sulfite reductase beta subunit-like hemoprotein
MACTGIEFCKLAIVDTKQRATDLVAELERRFPDLDTPITVNVNGCPNACARTQVADIGLKGQLVLDGDGRQVEGFQVHLGGGLGLDPTFGRKLRAHKVTSAGLDDYVSNVVGAYLQQRHDGDENLRPSETGHGAWECHACLRAFSLKMLGMIPRPSGIPSTSTSASTSTGISTGTALDPGTVR